jgi:hypothetical protein
MKIHNIEELSQAINDCVREGSLTGESPVLMILLEKYDDSVTKSNG